MSRTSKLMLLAAARALVVVAAAIALSSCGGSKTTATTTTTPPSNTSLAWAGSVCSAFSTWRAQVVSAGKSVQANPTKAGVEQGLADAKAATATLTTTLKGLNTPTTSASDEAQKALQQLKGQLQNDAAVIERTIKGASGASGSSQAASTVKTGIATMRSQLVATGKELRSLPSGELEQAFNDAPACKSLEASSSS